jgi:predicted nucleotidyltransferase
MNIPSIKPLQEREKELQCLYEVESVLKERQSDYDEIFNKILRIIPEGWEIPKFCHAVIVYGDKKYFNIESKVTNTSISAPIVVDNTTVGNITVFYKDLPYRKESFLPEEQKLLNTIASRIGQFIFYDKLEKTIECLSNNTDNKNCSIYLEENKDEFWKWRFSMAERIASTTDLKYYGIRAIYIIGSTKDAIAGPASDIDLMVHFIGDEFQKKLLKSWIKGWSYALEAINFEKTGYRDADGLVDLHIVTDSDIVKKTSFAVMIGSLYNSARLLKKID